MLCRMWHQGWISLALIVAVLVLMVIPVMDIYKTELCAVDVRANGDSGEILLVVSGMNLLRVNNFYLDGERVEDCTVSKGTYEECYVSADREIFGEAGKWHRIELGFSKWGILNLISSPVWIEWQIP